MTKRQRKIAKLLAQGYIVEVAKHVPPRLRANAHGILRAPNATEAEGPYVTKRTMSALVDAEAAAFIRFSDERAAYVSPDRLTNAIIKSMRESLHFRIISSLPGAKRDYEAVTLYPERRAEDRTRD